MLNLFDQLYIALSCRLNTSKTDETGGSEMIAVVVMIGIVVILAIVFKDKIADLVKSIFETTESNANEVMKPIDH